MIRRLIAAALAVLAVVAIWPAMSRAADSARAVHAVIDRVELAAVADDPGACAVMGAAVQQAYIRGAEVTSGVHSPVSSCAAAVRDDHAGYRRNREMAAERTAQQAVVKAFAAGTVSFSAHGQDATAVAHLTTRQFLAMFARRSPPSWPTAGRAGRCSAWSSVPRAAPHRRRRSSDPTWAGRSHASGHRRPASRYVVMIRLRNRGARLRRDRAHARLLGAGRAQTRQPRARTPAGGGGPAMSGNFFERLDADLAQLVHDGAHLTPAVRRERRLRLVARRSAALAVLAIVLAASLVSEFFASAGGRPIAPIAAVVLSR